MRRRFKRKSSKAPTPPAPLPEPEQRSAPSTGQPSTSNSTENTRRSTAKTRTSRYYSIPDSGDNSLKNRKSTRQSRSQSSAAASGKSTRSASSAVSRNQSNETQIKSESKVARKTTTAIHPRTPPTDSDPGHPGPSIGVTFNPIVMRDESSNSVFSLVEGNHTLRKCDLRHEGRKIMQEQLRVQVDALFNLLFSASSFLKSFHDMRKSTNLQMGDWVMGKNGERCRTVSVTVALQGNVGPKTSKVTEYQTMRKCSQPGHLYSIDVNSVNADIPYADAFKIFMHFCLTATQDNNTDVLVIAEVKFLKSVWAVVKGFIEKNTYAGLEEFFQSLRVELLKELKKKKYN